MSETEIKENNTETTNADEETTIAVDNQQQASAEAVENDATSPTTTTSKATAPKPKQKKAQTEIVPRGLPKSKRPWKTPKTRFATVKKSMNRLSFEKKMALRNELRHIKEVSREIKEQRKEAKIQKHQRSLENAERRLANERRAEIVQVIKNPSKLKRMKKKQMRMIQKRDLSQVKVV